MDKIQKIVNDIIKEAGATSTQPKTISMKIVKAMQDLIDGAKGKNGSVDSKHPHAREIVSTAKNIIREAKKLGSLKDQSEIWLRTSILT